MTIGQGFHAKSPPTHYLLALGVNFCKMWVCLHFAWPNPPCWPSGENAASSLGIYPGQKQRSGRDIHGVQAGTLLGHVILCDIDFAIGWLIDSTRARDVGIPQVTPMSNWSWYRMISHDRSVCLHLNNISVVTSFLARVVCPPNFLCTLSVLISVQWCRSGGNLDHHSSKVENVEQWYVSLSCLGCLTRRKRAGAQPSFGKLSCLLLKTTRCFLPWWLALCTFLTACPIFAWSECRQGQNWDR